MPLEREREKKKSTHEEICHSTCVCMWAMDRVKYLNEVKKLNKVTTKQLLSHFETCQLALC